MRRCVGVLWRLKQATDNLINRGRSIFVLKVTKNLIEGRTNRWVVAQHVGIGRWILASSDVPSFRITCSHKSRKPGKPAGSEIPAPQKNTTLPLSRSSKSSSGIFGPSAMNLMCWYQLSIMTRLVNTEVLATSGSNKCFDRIESRTVRLSSFRLSPSSH